MGSPLAAAETRPSYDEGDDVVILVQERARLGHAERYGHGVGGVARDKSVVLALVGLREAGEPTVLAQRVKALPTPGDDLVRVALVPHVEDQTILRRVVHAVQRDRQLNGAEIGGQVPAGLRDLFDQKVPQLRAQGLQLLVVQVFDVIGRVNSL